MRYPPYLVTLVFTCVIIGIIFSTINNDLAITSPIQNQKLIINNAKNLKNQEDLKKIYADISKKEKDKENEELLKRIKEREKELKDKEEERKKKIEEVMNKAIEEMEKIKELEKDKAIEEERKKKEEEEAKKAIEEEKKKKEEQKKLEESRKRREEARREVERIIRERKEEAERLRKKNDEEQKLKNNQKQDEKNIKEKKEDDEKIKKEKEEQERIKREKEEQERIKKEKEKEQKKVDVNIINEINIDKPSDNKNKVGKLRIACAYASDNAYVYPTLVAMTSLAENAGKNTFYDIYVMINPGFTEENKKVLKSVQLKHEKSCEVIFIDMGDKFKDENTNKKITTPAYYRLELHNLLPDVSRVIWMDGDTAVFEDLTELITLDMKGNYIMGFLDSLPDALEKNFNMKNATVLCSGVLLIDLDALRKNNMTEKFNKFMIENREKINQHDQTVINVVCQKNIGTLPPKYGIWCFEAEKYAVKHNERQRPHLRYNMNEFINAYYHPAILHYVWPKPFWKKKKPIFNKEWWDYARISGYYNEVFSKSPKWTARALLEKMRYFSYY